MLKLGDCGMGWRLAGGIFAAMSCGLTVVGANI